MKYPQHISSALKGMWLLSAFFGVVASHAIGIQNTRETQFPSTNETPATKYTPLMEIGKSWKYRLVDDCEIEELRSSAKDWMLRVDGTKEIDGEQWFIVNAYERAIGEDSYQTPVPYAYVHENVTLRQVRVLASEAVNLIPTSYDPILEYPQFGSNESEQGALVFDFINPENSAVVRIDRKDGFTEEWSYLTPTGNSLKGFAASQVAMIEGFGLMQKSKAINENLSSYNIAGSFLGERIHYLAGFTGGDYKALLYEIAAPDGTPLYSYDKNRNLETDGIAEADTTPAIIEIDGDNVMITAANDSEIGNIQVVNEVGAVVRDFHISDSQFTFNVTGYSPGMYIIRAGGIVRGIIVK